MKPIGLTGILGLGTPPGSFRGALDMAGSPLRGGFPEPRGGKKLGPTRDPILGGGGGDIFILLERGTLEAFTGGRAAASSTVWSLSSIDFDFRSGSLGFVVYSTCLRLTY